MQESEQPGGAASESPAASSVVSAALKELGQLGRALKNVFGAQLQLLRAELGLAKSSVVWLVMAAVIAVTTAVGVGLTFMAVITFLLAIWFGSWLWALVGMLILQLLLLVVCIVVARRCMRWMSLPETRGELKAMAREAAEKVRSAQDSSSTGSPTGQPL